MQKKKNTSKLNTHKSQQRQLYVNILYVLTSLICFGICYYPFRSSDLIT